MHYIPIIMCIIKIAHKTGKIKISLRKIILSSDHDTIELVNSKCKFVAEDRDIYQQFKIKIYIYNIMKESLNFEFHNECSYFCHLIWNPELI